MSDVPKGGSPANGSPPDTGGGPPGTGGSPPGGSPPRGGASTGPSTVDLPGTRLIQVSWAGTALFVITAVAATIAPDTFGVAALVVALALFTVGTACFLWGFALAVARSRTDAIAVGSLFFLAGSAPRRAQFALLGPVVVQTVVALVAASVRLYSVLAFGILVPMFGLGLTALWAARHGTFPPRS